MLGRLKTADGRITAASREQFRVAKNELLASKRFGAEKGWIWKVTESAKDVAKPCAPVESTHRGTKIATGIADSGLKSTRTAVAASPYDASETAVRPSERLDALRGANERH